jgi:hypothetical protein
VILPEIISQARDGRIEMHHSQTLDWCIAEIEIQDVERGHTSRSNSTFKSSRDLFEGCATLHIAYADTFLEILTDSTRVVVKNLKKISWGDHQRHKEKGINTTSRKEVLLSFKHKDVELTELMAFAEGTRNMFAGKPRVESSPYAQSGKLPSAARQAVEARMPRVPPSLCITL